MRAVGFFRRRRTLAHDETTVDSSQKENVPKYAGFNVGAHVAQSTHSVCFSVFFVHFVYLLGRFSEVNIGYQPPLYKPTLFINVVNFFFFLFLPPCVIYCAMTFYYFLCYCIIFFTHISLLTCTYVVFFFKLPHSFDVSRCFIVIIWDESGITSES